MKLSGFHKFFISLWFIGVILWIGGSIVRTTLAYDLFQAKKKLILKQYFKENDALLTARQYAVGSFYTEFGFVLSFVSAIVLLPTFRKNFRKRGWLLMAYILFSIASIFEFVLMYFDIRLALYIFSGATDLNYNAYEIQQFFVWRLQNLSFLIIYNWLTIVSIIFLIVYGPLTKLESEN